MSLQFIPVLFQIKNRCFLNFRCCIFPFFSKCMDLVFLPSFISSVACFYIFLNTLSPSNWLYLFLLLIVLMFTTWLVLFFKSISTTVKESDSDTIIMVIVLVAGVGGVFILFALMALCYRLENEIHLCSYAIHVVNALIKNVV